MALEENTSAESGISRRTIVKGAAWAAPVMIAAVAVPAAVASVPTGFTASPSTLDKGTTQTLSLVFTGFGSGTVRLSFVNPTHTFRFTSAGGSTAYTDVVIKDNVGTVVIVSPSANKAKVTLRASQSSPQWQRDQDLITS